MQDGKFRSGVRDECKSGSVTPERVGEKIRGTIECVCVWESFIFLYDGAWGDCSSYSRDGWAALPGLSSPQAAHESRMILMKAALTYLSWASCRWDITPLIGQVQDSHQHIPFYPYFCPSHYIHSDSCSGEKKHFVSVWGAKNLFVIHILVCGATWIIILWKTLAR